MKFKFSRICDVLLVGVLGLVGCTDYSQDIEDVNARLDQLTANQISSLTSQVSALEAYTTYLKGLDIENNVKALKENVAALQAVDATLTSELAAANANIAALSTELNKANANIQALNTDLDAVKAEAQANAAAIATANAKIQELVAEDATLAAQLNSLAANVQSNADAISANAGDIAALKTSVAALQSDIATYKALINGQIAALDTRLAAAETALATAQADIEAIEAQIEAIKADIAADKDDLANYKAETAATIEVVKKSIEDLGSEMDAKFNEVNAKFKDYVLTETFNLKINGLLNKLDKAKADYNAQIKALTKVVNANAAASAAQDALLAEADEAIKARVSSLETAVETINDKIADLENKQGELEVKVNNILGSLSTAEGKIAANETAIADLQSKVSDLKTFQDNTESELQSIDSRLSSVETDVNELLKRIQSLVYLPDYSDGKASIRKADLYGLILPGVTDTLKYRVAPAELTAQIVGAYNQHPEYFSYDVVDVITRAAASAGLEIKNILQTGNSGEIMVVVVPTNFDPLFYSGSKSYSAALKFSDGGDNGNKGYLDGKTEISTEYTNLIAWDNKEIKMDVTPVSEVKSINYISADKNNFFEPAEPKFFFVGDATKYTAAQLMLKGYDVRPYIQQTIDNPVYSNPAVEDLYYYKKVDCAENLGFVAPIQYCVAGLKDEKSYSEKRDAAGTSITMEMQFKVVIDNVVKEVAPYTGVLNVTKILLSSSHAGTAKWNWSENVLTDAANFDATNKIYVNNEAYENVVVNTKINNNLSDGGMTFADLVGVAPSSKTVYDASGVAVPSVVITSPSFDADGVLTYTVKGHEYNKNYTVEFVYEYEYAIVTVVSDLTTKDRTRGVSVELGLSTSIPFVRDMDADTDPMSIKKFLDDPVMEYASYADGSRLSWVDYMAHSVNASPISVKDPDPSNVNFTSTSQDITVSKHVNASDLDRETTVYTRDGNKYYLILSDKIWTSYGQEIDIVDTINVILPSYTVKHSAYRVDNDGVYFTRVEPYYAPEYNKINSYSVQAVDLKNAFVPVINGQLCVWDDPVVVDSHLYMDFTMDTPQDNSHITLYSSSSTSKGYPLLNTIDYGGYDDFVHVSGSLFIENTDGTKVTVPSPFDNEYSNYQVRKFNPFPSFTASEKVITVDNAINYDYNILESLSLKDARGWQCISNGGWVVGNDNNGFESGVDAQTAYSLIHPLLEYSVNFPDDIDPLVKNEITLYLPGTGSSDAGSHVIYSSVVTVPTLTFNYSSQLALVKPLVIDVVAKLNHPWTNDSDPANSVTVKVTFKK